MYVPIYQGLTPLDFIRPAAARSCFPFDAPHRQYFFRARNAIYHLFRALRSSSGRLTVLAPEYNSGNEVLAMQAAGATIRYIPVGRDLRLDPLAVERLCDRYEPDVLYVIHYAGWPQPMPALAALCGRRHMLLVEDCALALLSAHERQPLGTFGHWSVFCLYKTLPLPNGAVLVQNAGTLGELDQMELNPAGTAAVAGRVAELMVQRLRSRADRLGAAVQALKRWVGRAESALDVHRASVGDIGFEHADVDLAISRISEHLLARLDFDGIRRRRVGNFRRLAGLLEGRATPVFAEVPDGACPLFFPVLVSDKHRAAEALRRRGVDALEFWNDRVDVDGCEPSPTERFLRAHVLELPIHQDLTPRHLEYVAQQVSTLELRMRDVPDTVYAA